MSQYSNGKNTRRLILDACRRLFFEKGYHETSTADIARASFTNRNAIYYHFKSKDNIRYEVLWELFIADRRVVEHYCGPSDYAMLLAFYVFGAQFLANANVRKFILDYFADYPVYNQETSLGCFHKTYHKATFVGLLEDVSIDPLAFASLYGFLHGLFCLADDIKDQLDPLTLFQHCFLSSASLLRISQDKVDQLWDELLENVRKIPLDSESEWLYFEWENPAWRYDDVQTPEPPLAEPLRSLQSLQPLQSSQSLQSESFHLDGWKPTVAHEN